MDNREITQEEYQEWQELRRKSVKIDCGCEKNIFCCRKHSKTKQAKRIFDIINDLMDVIEQGQPEIYSSSNEIMRADDLLKELEDNF